MSKRERENGKRLESQAVNLLAYHGIDARRNLNQYQSRDGRDLVLNVPLCVQVKGGKQPRIWQAWAEAQEAVRERETPLALVRRDRGPWMVFAEADAVLAWYRVWLDAQRVAPSKEIEE